MLTTVAVLIIVLGLMVSLARYVRNHSATQLTRDVLAHLDEAMSRYLHREGAGAGIGSGGASVKRAPASALAATRAATRASAESGLVANALPPVRPIAPGGKLPSDERQILAAAEQNNRQFVAALRSQLSGSFWSGLPTSIYDMQMLRDAWGSPLVYMPGKQNEIGMAPQDRPFFFSPGPDRRYRTRADNLYSYEQVPR